MTFIALDNKNWCKGVYQNGKLHFDQLPPDLDKTWKYLPYVDSQNVKYAYYYINGQSLDDVCPDNIKPKWEEKKKKLLAFYNSFREAKIDLDDNCFFDLVPQQFLLELCEEKCKIIDYIFETVQEPENYKFLVEVEKILFDISQRELNIDLHFLKSRLHEIRARNLIKILNKKHAKIDYNIFGSKTGRLSVNPGSFPILNLDAKYRSIIKPQNDVFVEIDFNAAEIRTLLALSGKEQPDGDIHTWNAERLGISREQAKTEIFAWLYGSKKIDSKKYENFFELNKLLDPYYDSGTIKNYFKRKIKTDQFHSLNYLIQSTTSDLVLNQLLKINNILKNKKSFITFLVHDSLVIDLAKEDKKLVNNIVKEFANTPLGYFPIKVSIGKDYGNLRKI